MTGAIIAVKPEGKIKAGGQIRFESEPSTGILRAYYALGFRGVVTWTNSSGTYMVVPIDGLLHKSFL